MLCIKQTPDTEKLTFRESTVHEANNGQLCVHVMSMASKVPYIVTVRQFLQIHLFLDLDSFNPSGLKLQPYAKYSTA